MTKIFALGCDGGHTTRGPRDTTLIFASSFLTVGFAADALSAVPEVSPWAMMADRLCEPWLCELSLTPARHHGLGRGVIELARRRSPGGETNHSGRLWMLLEAPGADNRWFYLCVVTRVTVSRQNWGYREPRASALLIPRRRWRSYLSKSSSGCGGNSWRSLLSVTTTTPLRDSWVTNGTAAGTPALSAIAILAAERTERKP
jgi:hypothetical protein